MNLTELKAQYAKLGDEIKRLESVGVWKPDIGDGYYRLCGDGMIIGYSWTNSDSDFSYYAQGNAFPTYEAAELESKKRAVMKKLRDLAEGWVADWGDSSQNKWSIYYSNQEKRFYCCSASSSQYIGQVYFETEAKARHAIDTLGDELLVLLK